MWARASSFTVLIPLNKVQLLSSRLLTYIDGPNHSKSLIHVDVCVLYGHVLNLWVWVLLWNFIYFYDLWRFLIVWLHCFLIFLFSIYFCIQYVHLVLPNFLLLLLKFLSTAIRGGSVLYCFKWLQRYSEVGAFSMASLSQLLVFLGLCWLWVNVTSCLPYYYDSMNFSAFCMKWSCWQWLVFLSVVCFSWSSLPSCY